MMGSMGSRQIFSLHLAVVGALYLLIIRGTGCQEVEYHEQTKQALYHADREKASADIEKARLEQQRIWAKKSASP